MYKTGIRLATDVMTKAEKGKVIPNSTKIYYYQVSRILRNN